MKRILSVLFCVSLMVCAPVFGEGDWWMPDAEELAEALGVKWTDHVRADGRVFDLDVVAQELSKAGFVSKKRIPFHGPIEIRGQATRFEEEDFVLPDTGHGIRAVMEVYRLDTAAIARDYLFVKLSAGAMSREAIHSIYAIQPEGPGELSVVTTLYNPTTGEREEDSHRACCVVANIVFCIRAYDPLLPAMGIARQIEGLLMGGKGSDVSVPAR